MFHGVNINTELKSVVQSHTHICSIFSVVSPLSDYVSKVHSMEAHAVKGGSLTDNS